MVARVMDEKTNEFELCNCLLFFLSIK